MSSWQIDYCYHSTELLLRFIQVIYCYCCIARRVTTNHYKQREQAPVRNLFRRKILFGFEYIAMVVCEMFYRYMKKLC